MQTYAIKIKGRLPEHWSPWFDGLAIVYDSEKGLTTIRGAVKDQTALHGLLSRVRDLGLHLIAVHQLDDDCCEIG